MAYYMHMAKVAVIQVVYNNQRFMSRVLPTLQAQTHPFDAYFVIAGNNDGGKEYLQQYYPEWQIIDPGYNIGFARGHNELFATLPHDYIQLFNPDLVLEPDYLAKLVAAFEQNSQLGAVTGKLLHYDFAQNVPTKTIDSTGITYSKSGRGRDRGQHEIDSGQYDNQPHLIAACGAGVMYRRSALESIKMRRPEGRYEYFDEDFHSYWEDVDLGLRLTWNGWQTQLVPDALAYHGRGAGSSVGGYKKVLAHIRHHQQIPPAIRQRNFINHILLYIKNTPQFYFQFFIREFFMWCYILVLEPSTFLGLPNLLRQLPQAWRQRKYIQAHRQISPNQFIQLLS